MPVLAHAQSAAAEDTDDSQQDDGAHQGHQQGRHAEVGLVDGADAKQRSQEPTRDKRAHDAYDDIEQDALLRVCLSP